MSVNSCLTCEVISKHKRGGSGQGGKRRGEGGGVRGQGGGGRGWGQGGRG